MLSSVLGYLKLFQERLQGYLSFINFGMIFYLFIFEKTPLGLNALYWVLLIFTAIPVILFIDLRFIMPAMLNIWFSKNPKFMELFEDVKEIKEKLG